MPDTLAQKLEGAIARYQVCFHIQSSHENITQIKWEVRIIDLVRYRYLLNGVFTGLTIEGAVDQAIAFIESQLKEGGD